MIFYQNAKSHYVLTNFSLTLKYEAKRSGKIKKIF